MAKIRIDDIPLDEKPDLENIQGLLDKLSLKRPVQGQSDVVPDPLASDAATASQDEPIAPNDEARERG